MHKELTPLRHLHIACSEDDEQWLKEYQREVSRLAHLIIECVKDNPVTLLSPLHRELITEQACKVAAMESRLAGVPIYVDNLGSPLASRL